MLVIPIYNTIILPDVQYNLRSDVLTEGDIERVKTDEHIIILPIKTQHDRDELKSDDFYDIGLLAEVKSIQNIENGVSVSAVTKERVNVFNLEVNENIIEASYEIRKSIVDVSDEEIKETFNDIKRIILEAVENHPWGIWMSAYVKRWQSISETISIFGTYLDLDADERYKLIELDSLKERHQLMLEYLRRYRGVQAVQRDISEKFDESQQNAYKEMAIRKQMELLQQQLDDMHPESISEDREFADKIEKSGMSEEVKKEALRVLNRFKQEGKNGHEYGSMYDYLDFITSLQWKSDESKKVDLSKARKILTKEHYGMEKVKQRVLEQLAVMALNENHSGSILLFVGAPGTGKTSMGQSIAKALNRKYVRISLGGVRDEAEIRGHRRTYIGAMPGRIMDGIKRSKVYNPVMVLDEIDKLAKDYSGDPASALLEVLDPEQNNQFVDHYLNVPYDLSKVLFICTANTTDTIPRPLLDRMEVIQLSGYTPEEKYHIAKEHLLPKAIEEAGINKSNIRISDKVFRKIINEYTMEAGVRGLKKQLDKLCRYAAIKLVEEKVEKASVKENDLYELLGHKVSGHEKALKEMQPGVVTGLAWTQVGGEILFIETTAMTGSGNIHITGQLGDVMKESADISVSLVKSLFNDETIDFKNKDIHIHVPSGAVPKDGPSAGITLFTALTSLVTGVPVSNELAMTGEISLRGSVMPIGGLPEKLMAAERAGIKKVLIPFDNVEDLADVSSEIKDKLEIIPVKTIDDVILHSLNLKLSAKKQNFFYQKIEDFKFGVPVNSIKTSRNKNVMNSKI